MKITRAGAIARGWGIGKVVNLYKCKKENIIKVYNDNEQLRDSVKAVITAKIHFCLYKCKKEKWKKEMQNLYKCKKEKMIIN